MNWDLIWQAPLALFLFVFGLSLFIKLILAPFELLEAYLKRRERDRLIKETMEDDP